MNPRDYTYAPPTAASPPSTRNPPRPERPTPRRTPMSTSPPTSPPPSSRCLLCFSAVIGEPSPRGVRPTRLVTGATKQPGSGSASDRPSTTPTSPATTSPPSSRNSCDNPASAAASSNSPQDPPPSRTPLPAQLQLQVAGSVVADARHVPREAGDEADLFRGGFEVDECAKPRQWQAERRDGFHVLRHTYTSIVLEGGESVVTLARWLGHSSATITLDHYAHFVPEARCPIDSLLDGQANGDMVPNSADFPPARP